MLYRDVVICQTDINKKKGKLRCTTDEIRTNKGLPEGGYHLPTTKCLVNKNEKLPKLCFTFYGLYVRLKIVLILCMKWSGDSKTMSRNVMTL